MFVYVLSSQVRSDKNMQLQKKVLVSCEIYNTLYHEHQHHHLSAKVFVSPQVFHELAFSQEECWDLRGGGINKVEKFRSSGFLIRAYRSSSSTLYKPSYLQV